jgi:large subunit ribosomal protein L13
MNTWVPSGKEISRKWFILDADGATLGRVASQAAKVLMGKHKATYTPFIDTGDHIIVINASRVKLTGKKLDQKVYRYHTGYPGGLKETVARRMQEQKPHRMIELAIIGMLPKTKLGKSMYRKLQVYSGDQHPHVAQKPEPMALLA